MAHSKGLENLPQDPLREIMTRVGQQPGGAADMARAFSVSKTLRDFINDGDVLQSISFKDVFPCSGIQHEQLSEIGGLVVRCSRAGNLSAQFILSKVVLASSSNLCSAKIEASHSDASLGQNSTLASNLTDLYKATQLLDHLSVENTNPAELLNLVRTFLCRASVDDIVDMQRHLKNFVALFLVHGKKLLFQQFLNTLDQLCEKSLFPIVTASEPRNFVIEKLNGVCTMGYTMMGDIAIDEVVYRPLLECSVEMNDDIVYEMLLERVDIVETILKVGGQIASAQNNQDALLLNRGILCITAMLRGYLRLLIDHTAFLQSTRIKLVVIFDTIFDL
ncbi:uncharacterized protein LOC141601252 [Silene latifolia]|uniref:uncharacterized protein LOC141601252 n=1 Tax=Silene latifolia TaxID=37657 RepID=UPI003D7751F9